MNTFRRRFAPALIVSVALFARAVAAPPAAQLKSIYVRSYTFDKNIAYPAADVEALRQQLSAPGWQRLVQVRSRKDGANVDIYIMVDQGRASGLALIASEPREFTIVNIGGSIDLQKLRRLEGQFGIPRLQLEQTDKR